MTTTPEEPQEAEQPVALPTEPGEPAAAPAEGQDEDEDEDEE